MTPSLSACRAALSAHEIHRGNRETDTETRPLVSVVIPTLNCAEALDRTLTNLSRETWPGLEVVIADAGSRDGTIDVIRDHDGLVSRWISAQDNGISQGFNRGIALSGGDIVQITNAGDYLSEGHVSRLIDLFQSNPQVGFAYGDVVMIDPHGAVTRRVKGVANFDERYFDSMVVAPHPAMAVRREIYETVGLFNEDLKLAMDFEWLVRCLRAGFSGVYSESLVTRMAEGGKNNRLAVRRDWENLKITTSFGTMPVALAFGRFGLKTAMNVMRLGLETVGQEALSYRFRRSVDHLLGR